MTEDHEYFTKLDRPQTAKKLSILRKYFAVWLTIWSGDQCRSWVGRDWYVLDLLAGTGQARGAQGEILSGSSLVFLEEVGRHADRLIDRGLRIHLTMIEQEPDRLTLLKQRVGEFLAANRAVDQLVDVIYAPCDVNEAVDGVSLEVRKSNPCFLFVDPFGLEVSGATVAKLVGLPWSVDVLFNYMLEAVQRVHGVARGSSTRAEANRRTLDAFFGLDASDLGSAEIQDPATYAKAILVPQGHKCVAFSMKRPGSTATQYILLFASRNDTVIKIMRDVYAREMTDAYGQVSLFGTDEYLDAIGVIE